MGLYKLDSVTVGTDPVKVLDYQSFKDKEQSLNEVIVIVNGANDVTLGYNDQVTTSTGYPIDATVEPRSKTFTNLRQDIWAVAAVASSVIVDVDYNAIGPVQV